MKRGRRKLGLDWATPLYVCLCSLRQKALCHIGSSLMFVGVLTSGVCLCNNENALAAQAMNEREAVLTIPSCIKGRCLGS